MNTTNCGRRLLARMIRDRLIIQECKRVIAERQMDRDVIDNEIQAVYLEELERYNSQFTDPEARAADLARQGMDDASLEKYLHDRASNRYLIQSAPRLLPVQVEPVTEEEVEAFKAKNPDLYRNMESVIVRHILFRCPEDAPPSEVERTRSNCEEILLRLRAGESFTDLAKRFSEHESTKEQGGLLGEIKRGIYAETYNDFVETLLAATPGEPIGPIRSPMGNHVCIITGKQTVNSELLRQHFDLAIAKQVEQILERPDTDVYIKGAKPAASTCP